MSKDRNPKVSERGSHGDRRLKQSPSQLSTLSRNISSLKETIEIGSSDSDVIVLDSLSSSDDDLPSFSYITPSKTNVAGVTTVHRRSHQGHPSPPTSRQRSSSPRRISETPSPRAVSKTKPKPSSSSALNSVSRLGTPLPKRSKLNSGSAVASAESARSSGAKKSTHSSGSGASVRNKRRSPSPVRRRRLPQDRSRHRSESTARDRMSSSRASGRHSSSSRTANRSPLATHSQRSGFNRQPLKERRGSKGSSGTGRSSSRSKNSLSSGSRDTAKRGTFSSESGPSHRQRETGTGRFSHLGNRFSDSDSSDSLSKFDLPDEPGLIPSRSGAIRSPTSRCDSLPSQSGDTRSSTSRHDLHDKPGLASSRRGSTSGRDLPDKPGLASSRRGSTLGRDLTDEPGLASSRRGSTVGRDLTDEPGLVPSRSGVIRSPASSMSSSDLPDDPRPIPSQSSTPSSSTSRRDLPDEPMPVPSRSAPSSSASRRDFSDELRPVPSRSDSSTSRRALPGEPVPVPSRSGALSSSASRGDQRDGPKLISSGSNTTSSSASRRDLPDKPVPAPSKSGAIRRLFSDKDNSQKTTLNKTRHRSCNLSEASSPPLVLEPNVREASGSKTAATRKRHPTVIDLSNDLTPWEVPITAFIKEAESDTSHSGKTTESDKSHSSKTTESNKSHSSKAPGIDKSYSSKATKGDKLDLSKATETGSTSHPSKVDEASTSHSSKVLGTGKSHSETGKARSSKRTEVGKSCSDKKTETGNKFSSSKATKPHSSKADNSHSSTTSETNKSHSSKATETASKSHSSKVAETGKSHSSKPAKSGGNKKPSAPSASRLPKSSLSSSQPPPSGAGRGPKSQPQSHGQQNTPTGSSESPLKSLLQNSSTGKRLSDIIQSKNLHSPTFPAVPSLPIGTKGGPKPPTGTGHPRNKASQVTTPLPEVPGTTQPTSSGSCDVTGITSADPTVSSESSLCLITLETNLLQQTSSKKTSIKPLKASRRIKLKRSNPASQDVLTRSDLTAVTKVKGRGKGRQAVGHAQDKESGGNRDDPSVQSGSSADCSNAPSRPHSRESVSTLSSSCFPESTSSERIAHDTDDIKSLWSFPSVANPSSDTDSMSIVSGAGSLDIAVTLGAKTVQQTKSSREKHKHVRRQTARKSTGGFGFKHRRPSYSSGRLSGYGMVPLKSCTVDVVRTKWSRKSAAVGGADGSSGSSVPQEKVKRRKILQQQRSLREGGSHIDMDSGQTSAVKSHSDKARSTTAAKPSQFVDAVIMSECSIPDGIITPKKRKQRKEANMLSMVLESSDSEPDTDPTPAAKKPRLTPSLPPPTEHREASSSPELDGETCARTRVNKLPSPRRRIRSESSLAFSKTSSPSSLPASSSGSSAKLVLASPLQLGTLWDNSSRQTIKKAPSKSRLVPSVSLTPEVSCTNQSSVMERSPSGAGRSEVRDEGAAPVATLQSCGTKETTFPETASSKNKLSLRLKSKHDRPSSEPPESATPLPTPPPERSSSVPSLQFPSLSSPVSPASLKMSPRDEEYSLRLQETIAKLAGGGAEEEDGWNFGSPRRPSLLSPPTLATSQSDLTVSFRLASLSRQPSPPSPTDNSRSRLSSVTTTRLGTYVSQGVQAEIGMVVNREVLDSFLTVKINEVLYELKEMLEAADRQVARITKEKEELEKMVLEKERVIQKLTQTGFKHRQKRVDKATSTDKATKSASTQTKKLRMPKRKRITKRAQKSSRTKHASWKSLAAVLPAETPSCLRHYSEEELQPFFNQSFSPPLAPCSPCSGEPDAAAPGGDTELSEWLSREDSTSRCIPIRPQVRLIRAVTGGERLRRHSEPAMGARRNGLAVAEWDSLDVNLRDEFLQLWQMLNLFKELQMEPLLLRRLASVIETLDHLLSHIPPPQDQELALSGGDLQQRTTVGLSAWLLGSKLQQLIINLEKLHGDEKNRLPSYFRAELIHTRTVVIETLKFITHGMRHVTMFHDTKGFAIGTNTLAVPSTPSPDLSPSPAPSSLLQCNEEDLDDLYSSSASELDTSSSEEDEEEGEGRSARTSHFRYKRAPPSPSSCARVSPWCAKGATHTPTNATKSSIGVSPDVSMSIATAEPGLQRLSRAIQQLKVPTSTSDSSQVAPSATSGKAALSPTSTDPTSCVEKGTNKVALLEKLEKTITEKINQIKANRLPVPNRLNQLRDLFPVHSVSSFIPITPATATRSTPSPRVISPVSTATTGVGKNGAVTAPSSVVHVNARDLLPSSAAERSKESSTPSTAAATASSPVTQTAANISGTVCTSRVSPQQFTRITDVLSRQQSDSTPKPLVVGTMTPLTSHPCPVPANPPSSQPPLPLPNILQRHVPMTMKFNFNTLTAPPPSVNLNLPRPASAQVLNTLSSQMLPSNRMIPSSSNIEQFRHFLELAMLTRNRVGLRTSHPEPLSQGAHTVGAAVRGVQIPRHTLGHGVDLTVQAPSIAAAVTGTLSRPLAPLPTSTSQLTASPCQWTPENVSITGVATVGTEPRLQAGPAPSPHPLMGANTSLLNSQPVPVTQVSRLSTGVPLTSGLPTPRLQVVSTSQGIMIKWTFGEEHIHKQRYVDHYDLYAHANSNTHPLPPVPQWGRVGSVSPLPLPMAVTLTNFARGQCYFFAVRALFRGGGKSDYSEPKSVTL